MIASIKGKVIDIKVGSMVIEAYGVGYLIKVTNQTLSNIKLHNDVFIHTHMVVRENSHELYGFYTEEEMDFFNLLITISGIGPKSALSILNSSSTETLREGVLSGDASYLTKVSGIGKKSAEKIILELKDKFGKLHDGNINTSGKGAAIEALVSLGYSLNEARESVSKISNELKTEEIVKEALKNLG